MCSSDLKAVQKVHPENTLPITILYPVSIRKVMGNSTSLLHQAVFTQYSFLPSDIATKNEGELCADLRAHLREFTSPASIKRNAGIIRSLCESHAKAFEYNALDKVCMEQRKNAVVSFEINYMGQLHAADYGKRIRMAAFHEMPENAVLVRVTEIGDTFYIDWYQGMPDDAYVRAMRDTLIDMGMKGLCLERVE